MTDIVKRHAYKNTTSEAGSPTEYEIETAKISAIKCWFNTYGNPSYVFHMDNGDTYFLVDDYGAMNNIYHLSRECVKRKKDMFNRFA